MVAIRRAIVAGVAFAAAVGLTTVAATEAAAGTVSVNFSCASGGGPFSGSFLITITAPATATRGQTVPVTAAIGPSGRATMDTPAGWWNVFMDISLGGAASGTITANGLTNPAFKAGDPWHVDGGTASITLNNAGDVTYRPVRFVTNHGWGCGVQGGGPGPVIATTHVS